MKNTLSLKKNADPKLLNAPAAQPIVDACADASVSRCLRSSSQHEVKLLEMLQGELWHCAPQSGRAPAAPVQPDHTAPAHRDAWQWWWQWVAAVVHSQVVLVAMVVVVVVAVIVVVAAAAAVVVAVLEEE